MDAATESTSEILNFYKHRNVLITGGTGFMGKILIQKLLRECDDLFGIYLIIREKKGKDIHSRVEDLFKDMIFDKLKEEVPEFTKKIFVIAGDCSKPGLGLSEDDRQTVINKINIVFNMAASLNMDSKLRDAVSTNVRGTSEMLGLCHEIKELIAVVHVSTAYSNCNNRLIEERFYEPPISGPGLINLTSELNDKILANITSGLIDTLPNTYVFTKCVTEDIISKEITKLPIALFRPSIITNVYQDPVPGWINNVYGPCGILAASGAGILRVLHCAREKKSDMVPVDFCVNALIACPWHLCNKLKPDDQFPVYNYSASPANSLTWIEYCDFVRKSYKYPLSQAMWPARLHYIENAFVYYLLRFLLHTFPAFLVDSFLFITRRPLQLMKIYKKVHKFVDVLAYFTLNDFHIVNKNVCSMWGHLNEIDRRKFPFDMSTIDWEQYFKDKLYGIKYYLIKDDPKNVDNDIKRYRKLEIMEQLLVGFLWLLFLWILYKVIYFFI